MGTIVCLNIIMLLEINEYMHHKQKKELYAYYHICSYSFNKLSVFQAMEYIHTSNIRYHGSLHSQNCVIDSRFVLKVANFGLQSLRNFEVDPSDESIAYYVNFIESQINSKLRNKFLKIVGTILMYKS